VKSTQSFHCRPDAVTAARLFVRERLSGHPRELVQAAELLTSELAANSVRHARSAFEVEIEAQEIVRVEVSDAGEGWPTVLDPSPRAPSGRGLRIVELTADTWGINSTDDGKSVWFTLSPVRLRSGAQRETS
jgi:anti-sigma regulatory factor (Ser/Thr protein kinase)